MPALGIQNGDVPPSFPLCHTAHSRPPPRFTIPFPTNRIRLQAFQAHISPYTQFPIFPINHAESHTLFEIDEGVEPVGIRPLTNELTIILAAMQAFVELWEEEGDWVPSFDVDVKIVVVEEGAIFCVRFKGLEEGGEGEVMER